MIRGLYTAASGLVAGLRQQELVANNIANISTPGYRGESSAMSSFERVLAVRVGNAPLPVPLTFRRQLGVVGTGAYMAQRTSYLAEGGLRLTDAPLDIAIRGDGFFAVQGPTGTLYTRNGHFSSMDGQLVTAAGFAVLGSDDQPIVIDDGKQIVVSTQGGIFTIESVVNDASGELEQVRVQVGELQIVHIPAEVLVRAGDTSFVPAPGNTPVAVGDETVVVQGALEESNVDITRAATQLSRLSQQFSANQRVFATLDESLEQAVRDIGRVG